MIDRTANHSHEDLDSFFAGYGELHECEDFFDKYRALVLPSGRLPTQNFLVGSTLLREREVNWCQVLSWLLDARACPRLAGTFVRRLCKKWTKADLRPDEVLEVRREERSGDDRFDITLRSRRHQIVIEAKVNAIYDEHQHERYDAKLEQHGCGLYLTRGTLDVSKWDKRWRNCTWEQVARVLDECLEESCPPEGFDEQRWSVIARDFTDFILKGRV